MSVLFFKRFLQRPFQIASIMPSSRAMVERVASKIDFEQARVIAEYGPGEGVHSREIARRMRSDAQLLLFELDAAFSRDLERQFADDPRVHVLNQDAAALPHEMKRRGIGQCDYILSGIPFSILKKDKKRALLNKTHSALAPGGRFIIYQVTNELKQHATVFEEAESEYFLQNIPPMFITVFQKVGPKRQRTSRQTVASAHRTILVASFGMTAERTRTEKDSMGEMPVPESALYGASTQRAVLNFPISGYRFPRPFIRALGLVKWAAAQANHDLGLLDAQRASVIVQAAEEMVEGKLDAQFPLDIFQTGSGTSTNTNANEVIANRAAQLAGKPIGSRDPVHPNDHVNMGQSSNDVIPSAIHISAADELTNRLAPALDKLAAELDRKAREFWDIIKIGRTHLMDATPVRLGQEFSGYAQQTAYSRDRVKKAIEVLRELALGGTAVGTGLNRHIDFPAKVMHHLEQRTGIAFYEAKNHFEAQGGKDAVVEASGLLKTVAVSLFKIANDIRFLGSGPRCGIGEILLPATQPGSSIMPGKVNPVMSEAMMMACARVFGNDACITWAGANGNFELNVMMPVMAHALLESIHLLANAADVFAEKCVHGIVANRERCQEFVELSMAMVTGLAPKIGYDRAAEIAKESARTGKTVRQICLEKKVLPEAELTRILDPVAMTEPGGESAAGG